MAVELLRREFSVEAPLATAWRELADVAAWPRWAPHLRQVTVEPASSTGDWLIGRFRGSKAHLKSANRGD